MDDNQRDFERFYKGLETLEASLYPKTCNNCGKVFNTPESFLLDTVKVNNNGIKVAEEEDGSMIIEIFRNCTCGSTLLSNFGDRRDFSETGIQRRLKFNELLEFLQEKGVDLEQARSQLVSLANGDNVNIKIFSEANEQLVALKT